MKSYLLLLVAFSSLAGLSPAQSPTNLPAEISIDLGDGVALEFVLIRPGTFMMGSEKGIDSERPIHKVTITKPFYLGKYLVTQEQWQAVMHKNPSHFKGPKNPVEKVSWRDCQNFAQKLQEQSPPHTFRLPTEAEWEYACRAGSTTEYSYGDDESQLGEYAWFGENSKSQTHPVGQKKPNAWGLFDMHSNVWEWCQDWFGRYDPADATDPTGPTSGVGRVWRGGGWDGAAAACRSARRRTYAPGFWYLRCGVRLVMTANGLSIALPQPLSQPSMSRVNIPVIDGIAQIDQQPETVLVETGYFNRQNVYAKR